MWLIILHILNLIDSLTFCINVLFFNIQSSNVVNLAVDSWFIFLMVSQGPRRGENWKCGHCGCHGDRSAGGRVHFHADSDGWKDAGEFGYGVCHRPRRSVSLIKPKKSFMWPLEDFISLVLLWSYNFAFGLFTSEDDQPPVAKVLSSPPITLPVRTAVLDGSRSSDDKGGISYLWTRENSSPAAGVSTVQ